jgi:hypothetical protein
MSTYLLAPRALFASQWIAPRPVNPRKSPGFNWLRRAGRLAQLGASILSLVLGLVILIPVGVAISPLVLAYSRLAAGRGAA